MQTPRDCVGRRADGRQIARFQKRQPLGRREALASGGFVEDRADRG
jgi:hypothetical protein